jgi:hypothetical protein
MSLGPTEDHTLLEQVVQRASYDSKMLNKFSVISNETEETTELLDICRLWPRTNGVQLRRINVDSYCTNDMSQRSNGFLSETTFA